MDTLAIAERSFYRALLSLRTAVDMPAEVRALLPPLLRATSSRGAHLEVSCGGVRITAQFGMVSADLLRAALASREDARPLVLTGSALDAKEDDVFAIVGIGANGYVYLQRAAKRPLTYRHRENIELLIAELDQLTEPAVPDARGLLDMHESTRRFQTKLVSAALDRAGGNVTRAARALGVRRGLIYELVGSKPHRGRSS